MPKKSSLSSWGKLYAEAFKDFLNYKWIIVLWGLWMLFGIFYLAGLLFIVFGNDSLSLIVLNGDMNRLLENEELWRKIEIIIRSPWKIFVTVVLYTIFILMSLIGGSFLEGASFKTFFERKKAEKFSWRWVIECGQKYFKPYFYIGLFCFLVGVAMVACGIISTMFFVNVMKKIIDNPALKYTFHIASFVFSVPILVWFGLLKVEIAADKRIGKACVDAWLKLKAEKWYVLRGLSIFPIVTSLIPFGVIHLFSELQFVKENGSFFWIIGCGIGYFFAFLAGIYHMPVLVRFWKVKNSLGR